MAKGGGTKDAKGGKDKGKEKAKSNVQKAPKTGGGKAKKKKWSKGKVREKISNLVLCDKATYDKILSEVPSYRLITPSTISERLKVNGSVARLAIKELAANGSIRLVSQHSSQVIYTRSSSLPAVSDEPTEKKEGGGRKKGEAKAQEKAEAAAAAAVAAAGGGGDDE